MTQKIKSSGEYFSVFAAKSVVLNPDRGKGTRKPTSSRAVYGLDALRHYLQEILDEAVDEHGHAVGYLASARDEVKRLLADWEVFNSRQTRPKEKPEGEHAERINRQRATVKLYEAESRAIHALLESHNAEVAASAAQQAKHRKPLGHCKLRDGKVIWCDHRDVDPETGKFLDDGKSVGAYLEGIKKQRAAAGAQR